MIRCDYKTGMFASEPAEWVYEGPVLRVRGEVAAIANHEAAHTVVRYALGSRSGAVSVKTIYGRGPNGVTQAMVTGVSEPWREPGDIIWPATPKQKIPVSLAATNIFACWRPFLRSAMVTCAGHAAQRKYCASQGLPIRAGSEGDRESCERDARRTWACAGRDGQAMLRLAWARTQLMLDDPTVWKAVGVVEAALFSGLLWREPADPRPGDEVSFAIEGADVEALIEGAGLASGRIGTNTDADQNAFAPGQFRGNFVRLSRNGLRKVQHHTQTRNYAMRADQHLDIGSKIKSDVSAFSGAATSAVTGSAVQRVGQGYNYASGQLVVGTGAATGSPTGISVAGKLQDSADGSTNWNDVPGAAINAIVAENGTAKANVILRGAQSYVRAVVTPTLTGGSSPAIPVVGILIMGGNSESDS
jgi:hypothetical protein